jgi:hypothetical protein
MQHVALVRVHHEQPEHQEHREGQGQRDEDDARDVSALNLNGQDPGQSRQRRDEGEQRGDAGQPL